MKTLSGFVAVLALGLIGAQARAAVPKVDVSNESIVCDTLIGTAKIKPSLFFGGTATATSISLKGKVEGCFVPGEPATILSGTFKGTLVGGTNDCSSVLSFATPQAGTLTFTWKAAKTTPLLQTRSTVNVSLMTGVTTTLGDVLGGPSYFKLILGTTGVSGAFTGGDGGAGSSIAFITAEDLFGSVTRQCATTGLKTLHLGPGRIDLN